MSIKKIMLVVLLSLGLIACGGNEGKTESTNSNGVKQDQTLVIGTSNFNGDFYEGWTNSSYDANVRRMIWGEGLMTPTPKGELVTSQWVESLETSKSDPSKETDDIWTFKLKDNLKFSNGHDMTVEDVKFTYDFWLDKKAISDTGATSSLDQFLDRVEINKTDRTVSFYFKQIIYILDVNMETFILDSKTIIEGAKKGNMTPQQWVKGNMSNPIGYGAYKLDEYVPSQYVKLSINPYYQGNWEGAKPSIETVILQNVPTETQVTQLITGEIDVLTGLTNEEDIDSVVADNELSTNSYFRHGGGQINIHTDFEFMQLPEVRKAFAYEIDRVKFRNIFLGKYGIASNAPYSRNMWMIYDDNEKMGTVGRFEKSLINYDILDADGNWDADANLKEAHRLLDQAVNKKDGLYANFTKSNGKYMWNGKEVVINLAITSGWADAINLTLTKDIQEKFGMKVNVESMDWSIMANHLYSTAPLSSRKYHAFTGGTSYNKKTDYYSYRKETILPFGQGTTTNTLRYPVPMTLLEKMRYANPSTEEGKEQYKEAFRDYIRLFNRELPQIPMYSNNYYDAYRNDLVDFNTSPMWGFPYAIVKAKIK